MQPDSRGWHAGKGCGRERLWIIGTPSPSVTACHQVEHNRFIHASNQPELQIGKLAITKLAAQRGKSP
jgi:hypothetical protein